VVEEGAHLDCSMNLKDHFSEGSCYKIKTEMFRGS